MKVGASMNFDEIEKDLARLSAKYSASDATDSVVGDTTSDESTKVYVTTITEYDRVTPVGANSRWNIHDNYPFKHEPPVILKGRDSAYTFVADAAIMDWCEEHGISYRMFNHPCIFDEQYRDYRHTFMGCEMFNQPVVIPEGVEYCIGMFSGCYNFNQEVIIPSTVRYCMEMFNDCYDFTSRVVFVGDKRRLCDNIFDGCSKFDESTVVFNATAFYVESSNPITAVNKPAHDSAPITDFDIETPVGQNPRWNLPEDYPFKDEPPIYITQGATEWANMDDTDQITRMMYDNFSRALSMGLLRDATRGKMFRCYSPSVDILEWLLSHGLSSTVEFNHPCIISPEMTNCTSLFEGCKNFNQPVVIPEGVTSCSKMFRLCSNFNQPVVVPVGVKDCNKMFNLCTKLNQTITLPDCVTDFDSVFESCFNLSKDSITVYSSKSL